MQTLRNMIVNLGIFVTATLFTYFLFWMTYFSLVPWDVMLFRPDDGLARIINDFFEVGIGTNLLFVMVALSITIPILRALRRRWDAGLRIMIANLLGTILGWGLMTVIPVTNYWVFPIPSGEITGVTRGYQHSILPMLAILIIYIGWHVELNRLSKPTMQRKQKAKNDNYLRASNNLRDDKAERDYNDNEQHLSSTKIQRTLV